MPFTNDVKRLITTLRAGRPEGDADRRPAPGAGPGDSPPDHCRAQCAGFEALRVPHMAVLQFRGPDGVRPGVRDDFRSKLDVLMNERYPRFGRPPFVSTS